jgi:hypothetical protein
VSGSAGESTPARYTHCVVGDIERLLAELTAAGVRYLVVGGVAVVLHGYLRATADLDLVIDLAPENASRAVEEFVRLGFRPRAPVPLHSFADPRERQRWITEKNLMVLSLWHPDVAGFEVDLFVQPPFDFEEAYRRSVVARLGAVDVATVSIDDLIAMKNGTSRAIDAEDVRALQWLKEDHG